MTLREDGDAAGQFRQGREAVNRQPRPYARITPYGQRGGEREEIESRHFAPEATRAADRTTRPNPDRADYAHRIARVRTKPRMRGVFARDGEVGPETGEVAHGHRASEGLKLEHGTGGAETTVPSDRQGGTNSRLEASNRKKLPGIAGGSGMDTTRD